MIVNGVAVIDTEPTESMAMSASSSVRPIAPPVHGLIVCPDCGSTDKIFVDAEDFNVNEEDTVVLECLMCDNTWDRNIKITGV